MTITTSDHKTGSPLTGRSLYIIVVCTFTLLVQFYTRTATAADPLDRPIRLDIQANTNLEDALINWGTLAGVTVMINTSTVAHHLTPEIHGVLSARGALSQLLRDSGLSYTQEGRRIHIVPTATLVHSALGPEQTNSAETTNSNTEAHEAAPSQSGSASDTGDTGSPNQSATHGKDMSEVIVTAEKYAERLQDVPIPVTALSAESLTENSQTKLQDYYTQVPGLTLSPNIISTQILAIRGITTGGLTTATVGVTVDDIPFGGTRITNVPDIDPGDLARIEVLRGPQGTLYGASSMGGLLKFVTLDPSTEAIRGRVEAGTNSVYNGAEEGYSFRGSVNVPLGSELAIRASAFTREDPGYIDNPILGIEGINRDRASGGRLAALWKPSETLAIKLTALYQYTRGDGLSLVDPTLGRSWEQNFVRGVGEYYHRAQAYGLVVNDKIGAIEFTAITGYNKNTTLDSFDTTAGLGQLTQSLFGVTGTPSQNYSNTSKFSQEFRISASIEHTLDLLLGAFYTHEYTQGTQTFLATNATTGAVVGIDSYGVFPVAYLEYAAFADLTYHLTDRFDVQIGGRQSHIQQIQDTQSYSGPLNVPDPSIVPEARSTDTPATYLLTPRFKVSPDLMLYARLASGYRPGGANPAPASFGIPAQYYSDKTQDYELGTKGSLLGGALSFDVSVYYIDWKNIQIALIQPSSGFLYTANAGAAKSQGAELSLDARPIPSLKISGWVAYNDAELTAPFPPAALAAGTYAVAGNRLPYSPRVSGNLSMHEELPVTNKVTAFAEASASYVGGRQDVFTSTPQRQYQPAYTKVDLRAGATYGPWKANFYVNNVANRLGVISGGYGNYPPEFFYIQPRTIGLSVSREF